MYGNMFYFREGLFNRIMNAFSDFMAFLQGKTSEDFRKMADDMDRNGTKTFEEYQHKWSGDMLDWQVEQRKQKLQLKAHRREIDIER